MEINLYPHSVEIKDGTSLEINFWDDGEIVISGIGYDDVTFSGIPESLIRKIQLSILEWKMEQ